MFLGGIPMRRNHQNTSPRKLSLKTPGIARSIWLPGDLGDGGLGDAELEEVTDFILLAVEP